MRVVEETIARRAFGAVADMKRSAQISDLESASKPLFADIGLPHFALARFFKADKTPDVEVLAGCFQPAWAQRYVSRRYAGESEIARAMFRTASPYSWEEALAASGSNEAQAEILGEARDFGLSGGLFTPVRWSDGSYAAVVLAGPCPQLGDQLLRSISEVLSAYYFSEARRIIAQEAPELVTLSPRQRECLAWARHGKSSSAIGDIIGIAVTTVDEHISEACRRLGVRTRTQAAVEASLRGLLDE